MRLLQCLNLSMISMRVRTYSPLSHFVVYTTFNDQKALTAIKQTIIYVVLSVKFLHSNVHQTAEPLIK